MTMHLRQRGLLAAVANTNVAAMLGEMNQAFASFRERNDGEISELQNAVDRLSADIGALRVGGAPADGPTSAETRRAQAALVEFMRTGRPDAMSALMPRAEMSTDSNPDGGYTVPTEIDRTIQNQMIHISPMRRLASIARTGTSDYHKLINKRGASSGWVGERDTRSETDTPLLGDIVPPMGELYAQPEITAWMAEDSQFDLMAFLQENVSDEFAYQEGAAFTTGDGLKKPMGFLSQPTSADDDGTRAFGTLQFVKSGAAASFAASNPGDALINLVYKVKSGYRSGPGVGWQMNSATLSVIRQFKDGQGNYLWQKTMTEGQPSTLCGYPVFENEDMPDIGANAFPVAFGNWRRGYLIVDRSELRLLRDPFTKKGWIRFYFTKRVGGATTDSRAIKLLKIAA